VARPKNPIPQPRSGQARVTIDGKDYYLGKWGSPEADEAYRRIVAQWLAKEGPFAIHDDDPVTIEGVLAGYRQFAVKYYRFTDKNSGAVFFA
jgi:hypothetical protein